MAMKVTGGLPGKINVTVDGSLFEVENHLTPYDTLIRLAELVNAKQTADEIVEVDLAVPVAATQSIQDALRASQATDDDGGRDRLLGSLLGAK